MNTLTRDPKKARKLAKELANLRGQPVWCHFASTLTYYLDYIPHWWKPEDIEARRKAGEIIDPTPRKGTA